MDTKQGDNLQGQGDGERKNLEIHFWHFPGDRGLWVEVTAAHCCFEMFTKVEGPPKFGKNALYTQFFLSINNAF